jgi:ribosomal protein S18 acetylase RimI-like enzyme
MTTETRILACNCADPLHAAAFTALITAYIADEMGGGSALDEAQQAWLVDALAAHPKAIILLAETAGTYCGLLTAFENVSTFTARPMINIHDLFVLPEYRSRGVGRMLMDALVREARDRRCSRITLEVRLDNCLAQRFYVSAGFGETEPSMLYWRKSLE